MKNRVLIFNLSHFSFDIFYFSFSMNHYSQHCFKVAATEPEHVVRKAEFDSAVGWLDERIVMIEETLDGRIDGPAVLQTNPSFEIVMMSDTVESPQTLPILENAVLLADSVLGNKPPVFQASAPSEVTHIADTIDSPPYPDLANESTNVTEFMETTFSKRSSRPRAVQVTRSG